MTLEQEREVRPVGRYEWEQIVRRARLSAVITSSGRTGKDGRSTKGGVSGTTFTGIALGWATYANDRGQEIWPGDATVAVDLETSIAAVRKVRKALLELGLLQFVRNRTTTRGVEYRLTLPVDLLELLDVLTPAQHKLAASRLRDAARGKPAGLSAGVPSDGGSGGPAEYPDDSEEPADGGSNGPPEIESGYSAGTSLGGPPDTHTDHDRTTGTTTDHSEKHPSTAVTVSREPAADPNPFSDEGIQEPPALRLVGSRRWSSRGQDTIAEATARRAARIAARESGETA